MGSQMLGRGGKSSPKKSIIVGEGTSNSLTENRSLASLFQLGRGK